MSLESWKDEFLTKTDLEKWIGLRKENLDKHDCSMISPKILTDIKDTFMINGCSCQLCTNYRRKENNCFNCPLSLNRNFHACDSKRKDEIDSPFGIWIRKSNPEPMIEALTAIKDKLPQRTNKVNL